MIPQNASWRASASDAREDSDKSRVADRSMVHDVSLAARSDTCVLLTGRTAAAGALARRIHVASGWRHGSLFVIDCEWPAELLNERLFRLLSSAEAPPRSTPRARLVQAGTVFLQEVGGLGATVQVQLADRLGELRAAGRQARSRWRVIASSSEPLVQRVAEGTFDDRLFYRLNVIHLFARDAGRSRTAGVAEDTSAAVVSLWTQELRTPAAQQREKS